ncbi:MAG TPA: M20 family metallo-hydrolase [Thermoanaerobaculaceae bacterium]|nr:M20 family metallo-hydrolase [Thermoanaerobaculaceae bacterium]
MQRTVTDELRGRLDGYRDWAVEVQRGLTAIPAVSPDSGGEGECDKAAWLEGLLAGLAFDEVVRYDAPDPRAKGGVRPNIVARYRGGSSSRSLWIMSHLDVVPPGERSLWTSDPWVLRVEDGRVIGRGVEDNQQAIVSSLLLARALMDSKVRPPIDLALLFCADEENGSAYGADFLASRHPEIFGPHDMFVVPDAGNADGSLVEVAEKSLWWVKVRTLGKQCHASTPALGANAFRAASDLVTRLASLSRTFPQSDAIFDPPTSTFEPTKKEANVPNVNTIPGDDAFYLDCRVLPSVPLADVEAEIRRLAREVEQAHGVSIALEDVQRAVAAPATTPDAEVVRLLVESIREVHGITPSPKGIGGGTVAAIFRRLGLPAVVYSKIHESAHQPDEFCVLDNLIGDAKVFAGVAMRCSPRPPR